MPRTSRTSCGSPVRGVSRPVLARRVTRLSRAVIAERQLPQPSSHISARKDARRHRGPCKPARTAPHGPRRWRVSEDDDVVEKCGRRGHRDALDGCAQRHSIAAAAVCAATAESHWTVVRVYRERDAASCRYRPHTGRAARDRYRRASALRDRHRIDRCIYLGAVVRRTVASKPGARARVWPVHERSGVAPDVPGDGIWVLRIARTGGDASVSQQPNESCLFWHWDLAWRDRGGPSVMG